MNADREHAIYRARSLAELATHLTTHLWPADHARLPGDLLVSDHNIAIKRLAFLATELEIVLDEIEAAR